MKLKIEYTHQGTNKTVVTLPADIIGWERKTRSKLSDLFGENGLRIGFEDLAVMAWAVESRQTPATPPFEVWLDDLAEITDFGDVDVDPTQAEASADSD